jgi:pilus assembly protein CpaF
MTAELATRVRSRLLEVGGAAAVPAQVAALVRDEAPPLPGPVLERLVAEVVAEVTGLGPLEALMADPGVTEVMVNGPGRVWVERDGTLQRVEAALDGAAIQRIIERVVGPLGLRVDRSSPLVDARLPDGSRVNVVVPPLAVDGPCVTIRRFGARALPLSCFCPPPVAALLAWAVRARCNIVVSGGTGAGKTTLLNTLAGEIPSGHRVVTVEDTAELRLAQEHVVRLEARPPNAEGAGGVSVRDLVRNALRMRPDRIVVGECRGAEALDMLQAMNTGHEGSLSTLHANSPADALRRLETMVLLGEVALPITAVREQIAASVDLVVQVLRGADGARRVTEVAEVRPPDDDRRDHDRRDDDGRGQDGRTTCVATAATVVALPRRPRRCPDAGPADPSWVGP